MKTTQLFLLLTISSIAILSSCKKPGDDKGTIPDATFTATVSGAESHNFSFTMPGGNSTTFSISGSQVSNLLGMVIMQVPPGWQMSLYTNASSVQTGTFQMPAEASSFVNPSQTVTYHSTSGSVTFTKADMYQVAGTSTSWYCDGSFTMTMEDVTNPATVITISGSFTGVHIAEQN